ncbi:MAG: hypothetical protein COW00_07820 [Bdellovibrio sp. CG12_big_fil_rev_8_21_14_0_65_39_13]|nr:MAG: hypothetical protein COW78_12500 [Bdellovibrio sp. CG22_combo_CG10-13_8_21_14_all_39_27]PIQ60163.1 MAG: hypothetical protein COW00_07820 [Bdellovibrio sp. CG12_big_fil_rev_8_21_14_0_65_39_13]PIR36798.1 MAG: hypothetical protein COV37_01320 [Bdellovibrio sp. CG11_big_fil_rev_8_21_14_0_20_39_38]PJB54207.1 MAG: DUF1993 domain-containing protein [Bdellovibrio sp. CG_4_9_14_3_um_filter_39_7]
MENLVHEIIVTSYIRNLKAMKTILAKAKAHADTNKFEVNRFMDMKLAPDMFNFTKQIQIATDNAKGAVARLAAVEAPVFADTESTWEEITSRLDQTIAFISKFKAEDFKNWSEQKITFPWYPGKAINGKDYLTGFAIPNFYFHLTTAYDLLRQNGVQIGKQDFLGEINWINA